MPSPDDYKSKHVEDLKPNIQQTKDKPRRWADYDSDEEIELPPDWVIKSENVKNKK
tara:strand:+ start:510 stop:677 length:168 start_codon:yes stop_codon:yes gene_type:complete